MGFDSTELNINILPRRCMILSTFSNLLLVLNSSVNIMIYGWKDKKFREILLKTFHLTAFLGEPGNSEITTINLPLGAVKVEKDTFEEVEETKPLTDAVSTIDITVTV